MNNDNLHKIFNNTACITTEKMIDYQEGKLSEIEKNSVEKHLSSCSMCQDEFEGLQQFADKSIIPVAVFELNNRVDSILSNTHKKIPFLMPINLMAAIILFVIGFAWYSTYYIHNITKMKYEQVSQAVYKSKDKGEIIIIRPQSELSKTEKELRAPEEMERIKDINGEVNSNPVKEDELESIKREESDNSLANDKIVGENQILKSDKKKEENNPNIVSSGNITSVQLSDIKEDSNKNIQEEKNNIAENEDKNLANNNKDVLIASDESNRGNKKSNKLNKAKSSSEMSNTVRTNNFSLAMADYNKRDYRAAIELFKQSLNENQPEGEVYFYLAMSYENLQQHQEALSNYNKVITNQQSPRYEQALWNKSQILLQLDKKKSAINALNQVKNLNGNYSKQAEKMIDSLNIK